MAYSPKYIQSSEIPVQIPDDYSEQEKLDAIEYAEASAELDLYNGETISQNLVTSILVSAIKQKATCELAKGSEHPDDVSLGDLDDSGSTKASYAFDAFCERYDELIGKIKNAGGIDPDSTDDTATEPYVYNTSPPDDDWREH